MTLVDQEQALRALLDRAVSEGVTPGLVAVAANGGEGGLRFVHAAGRLRYDEDAFAVEPDTIYDLASLTKALSTTLLAAVAVCEGALSLDEAPWPSWPGVTVAHALRHDGGLVAWSPFYQRALDGRVVGLPAGGRVVVDAVLDTPPAAPPGAATVYSDLGFIALGALLEERLAGRLDHLFARAAREAWGESGLRYVPLFEEGYHPAYSRVAPTEECPWRARVVQGQVHDDNAFAMGGVAGHAGLFGSAADVEQAARHLLDATRSSDGGLRGRLRAFALAEGTRGLGFDRATKDGTTGGALSETAFGHLGFTGTSMWMDPEGPGREGSLYVLLTNRVHPSRDGQGIRELRVGFHRAARALLDEAA